MTPASTSPSSDARCTSRSPSSCSARSPARRLRPGDPLPPERELTESFGVGRSSIREALRMLESQGVITAANGGSFIVAHAANPLNSSLRLLFTLDERGGIHDLFELRRILECEAAALAAARRSDEHLEEMDAAVAAMAASLAVTTAAPASSRPTCDSISRSPRRRATGSSCTACRRCATSSGARS